MKTKLETINVLLEDALCRSTCVKRAVGAVMELANGALVAGWNGPTEDFEIYCIPCPRGDAKSGDRMDICPAVHAEIRALLRCRSDARRGTLWITCGLPCKDCMKELVEAGITKIVSPYPLGDGEHKGPKVGVYNFPLARKMMESAHIEYVYEPKLTKGETAHVQRNEST
jgi:deoxycytidylate deaminase